MAFSEPVSYVLLRLSALTHRIDRKMHQVPCYAPEQGFISLNSDSICFQICVAGTDCMTVRVSVSQGQVCGQTAAVLNSYSGKLEKFFLGPLEVHDIAFLHTH